MKWPVITLVDALASADVFVDGDWVESKDQDPEGDVRLVQLADIGDGEYVDKSDRFLTSAKARELRCTFLKPGDVLVARMPDPLGRACIFPGDPKPAVTVVDVCIIRPDPQQHDARWLMHCLNGPDSRIQIAGYATGTTRSRISRSNLGKVRIPIPSLPEQRRIAAILDKADTLRSKRRAALAQLDTLTQSIFLDMFGDPATNPKGWPVRTFDETMRDETAKTEKLQRSDYLPEGRYPVVDQGQSIIAGYCDDERYLCPSELPVVVFGDHTRAVKLVNNRFVVGADGAKVLVPEPGVEAVFLSYLMRELPIPDLGYSRHMREVKRLSFPVPPSARQREFAQRVASIEMHCKAHDRSRLALDSLFAVLQHHAFRGEL